MAQLRVYHDLASARNKINQRRRSSLIIHCNLSRADMLMVAESEKSVRLSPSRVGNVSMYAVTHAVTLPGKTGQIGLGDGSGVATVSPPFVNHEAATTEACRWRCCTGR